MSEPQTDTQKTVTTIDASPGPIPGPIDAPVPIRAAAVPAAATMFEYESCTRAPCFGIRSDVHMGDGTRKCVSKICIGDVVATETGTATVKYILITLCDNELCEIVTLPSGLCLTPWHPVKYQNEWIFPNFIKRPTTAYCPRVYSFVLDKGHTMVVSDTVCITLGHGITDGILNHPYFGTHKVIDDLAVLDGGRGKPITISSVYINRDETGKVCSIKRPYEYT